MGIGLAVCPQCSIAQGFNALSQTLMAKNNGVGKLYMLMAHLIIARRAYYSLQI
jgi:hypothetical protein